jgi:hypothetical protein
MGSSVGGGIVKEVEGSAAVSRDGVYSGRNLIQSLAIPREGCWVGVAPGETVTGALMEVEVPVAAEDSESTTVTALVWPLNRARPKSTATARRPGSVKILAQADAEGFRDCLV